MGDKRRRFDEVSRSFTMVFGLPAASSIIEGITCDAINFMHTDEAPL